MDTFKNSLESICKEILERNTHKPDSIRFRKINSVRFFKEDYGNPPSVLYSGNEFPINVKRGDATFSGILDNGSNFTYDFIIPELIIKYDINLKGFRLTKNGNPIIAAP